VISSVHPIVASAWPAGWEDVEVVDSVLIDDPPAAARADAAAPEAEAGVYDRSGRVPAFRRFGRIVDVLA
jgi:hypothetical protein